MYKLFKYLFNWDYIYWTNSTDCGISKIFVTKDGRVVYWRYKLTNVLDEIVDPKIVVWLTCEPSIYFSRQEENDEV